ncbi:shikimate dehydrogenase [Janibacter terrae]|uniref:shikimate dehydrogenase n=1 Tax=Janibacter terrae TaxID=103817 RepID=UPI000AAE834B|nr:shikimate dehydrogenase [Janibacter terrae]
MTLHAGVLGSPIRHSLSPTLHRAGYAAAGLPDWAYTAHEVDEGGLAPFVAGLDASWRGLSLTMPLKVAAFDVADEVSALARAAGAINTLVRTQAGWSAHNTDVHGIVAALRDAGVHQPRSATVIGAGATARSALLALRELGLGEGVSIAARDETKAQALIDSMPDLGFDLGVTIDLAGWWFEEWPPVDVVISTVPAGAANEAVAGMLGRPAPELMRCVTLLDVVYADWPTPLARAAAAHGATVVSGLEMLVHQAARQFELFTGATAPVEAMQAAGREALGHTPDA